MYPYLMECRLYDDVKHEARDLIHDVARRFGVRGAVRHRPVPHVTLFGPFGTRNIGKVKGIMADVGPSYGKLRYELDGFGYFEKSIWRVFKQKRVIYMKIRPSEEMAQFRRALAERLFRVCRVKEERVDRIDGFVFHSTIAINDIAARFDDIWEYLERRGMKGGGACYRATLLENSLINCEFDFVLGRMQDRRAALSRQVWRDTKRRAGYRGSHPDGSSRRP